MREMWGEMGRRGGEGQRDEDECVWISDDMGC